MSYTRLNPKYETFNVTYAPGVSSADTGMTRYERYGKVVHVTAPLTTSQLKVRHDTIFTIPSGFRPSGTFYFQAMCAENIINFCIAKSGTFYAETNVNWSSGVLWLDVCYISE